MNEQFYELKKVLSAVGPEEGLKFASDAFGSSAKFSSSLGMEDQVLTHWIARASLEIEIFTIDTGRLFQETYDLLTVTINKYKVPVKTYFPSRDGIESLISTKGPNSFYESVENRKECCYLRKVEPLKRALAGASLWVTGIRAEQSDNRRAMELVSWDDAHQVIKYNPLLNWTRDDVQSYIDRYDIPVNELHRDGFPSIGCAPCTRRVLPGEDDRAGRWWWEGSNKECGLHETRVKRS